MFPFWHSFTSFLFYDIILHEHIKNSPSKFWILLFSNSMKTNWRWYHVYSNHCEIRTSSCCLIPSEMNYKYIFKLVDLRTKLLFHKFKYLLWSFLITLTLHPLIFKNLKRKKHTPIFEVNCYVQKKMFIQNIEF